MGFDARFVSETGEIDIKKQKAMSIAILKLA